MARGTSRPCIVRTQRECWYGLVDDLADGSVLPVRLGAGGALLEADGGEAVNWLYLIAGLIALALFAYLVVALLKPEVV